MADGLIALTGWQTGTEVTRGTGVPATRFSFMEGTLKVVRERYAPQEDRNSFEDYFRSAAEKQHVEISSPAWGTYEDQALWYQLFMKGGVAGVLSNVAAYTYTFAPNNAADDLATWTWEPFNDTDAWSVPYCVGKKMELDYTRGQPVKMTLDILGQRAIAQAKTAGISQRVTNDIHTALTVCDIDLTTIGSTAVTNVLAAKMTLDNMWEPIYTLSGNEWVTKYIRPRRHLVGDLTIEFDTTTEYDAFMNTAAASTQRKVRLKSTGDVIPTSSPSTNMSHQLDFYTKGWDTFDFGRQGGIWTAKMVGRSTYDATATNSWSAVVVNGVATLP